ncbi:Sel1 repeat-containing protein [Paraburkholderia lycopersici]|uniref:Sel1 repeat-containing protein n=2 Tax=Paraburkholderia lycopersici TaxID=416944 RepID=A0A1G6M032_9BURK|nr:Sel1 repeat-containing protein [Paraburkholderia lycopersici]
MHFDIVGKRFVISALTALLGVPHGSEAATPIVCPSMPASLTTLGNEGTNEIRTVSNNIAQSSVSETSHKTTVASSAVFAKFPHADRMLALQMMAATYCSMIHDFNPELRSQKWKAFYDSYVGALPTGPTAQPKPVPKTPHPVQEAEKPPSSLTYDEASAELSRHNAARAFEAFKVQSENGDGRAAYQLGRMYQIGIGMSPNPALAHEAYLRAANLGIREAQHNLAVTYQNGDGTEKNLPLARLWFEQAARQGFEPSKRVLQAAGENF